MGKQLFLLADWKTPDGQEFKAGQIVTTSSEDETKTLLFDGTARLATGADLTPPDKDKGAITDEKALIKLVAETVKATIEEASKAATLPITGKVAAEAKDDSHGPYKSFGQQLQDVAAAAGSAPDTKAIERLRSVKAPSGLSETVPSDGGFLVQTDFIGELYKQTIDTGILAPRCRQIRISSNSNSVKMNAINQTSRANGSRAGGVRMYWTDEAGEKTASKPEFRQIELSLNKLTGLYYATDELLMDAAALESAVTTEFASEAGFKVDDAIVNGTGAGQPLGIMAGPCLVSVAKEAGQAATTLVAENVEKMYARMWARSMRNAVWYINQDVWPQIFQFAHSVGTGGVPMFIPGGGINSAPFGTLLGRPIEPIEQCQTLGTKGDIIFADFSQYLLADKGTMQGASSIHVRFIYDETTFRFVYRVDGQPAWNSALTPFKGTNTLSPFVVLDARS